MKATKNVLIAVLAAGMLVAPAPVRADFISFGTTVVSFVATDTDYSFTFGTSIGPLTGLVSFSGTLQADVLEDRDGVTVSPFMGSFLEGSFDLGPAFAMDSLATFNADFGPTLVFSGIFDCGAGCTSLEAHLHFTLSGFDQLSFSGNITVLPVPEPATLALLGLGLAALAVSRRRIGAA